MKDQTKILDDEVVMQNYGVIAEITEEGFREAVHGKNFNTLIAKKKVEN